MKVKDSLYPLSHLFPASLLHISQEMSQPKRSREQHLLSPRQSICCIDCISMWSTRCRVLPTGTWINSSIPQIVTKNPLCATHRGRQCRYTSEEYTHDFWWSSESNGKIRNKYILINRDKCYEGNGAGCSEHTGTCTAL